MKMEDKLKKKLIEDNLKKKIKMKDDLEKIEDDLKTN
jgi:hypothetical protein